MKISLSKIVLGALVLGMLLAWTQLRQTDAKTTQNVPAENSVVLSNSFPLSTLDGATIGYELYFHDKSSAADQVLVSKTWKKSTESDASEHALGDLWLQDDAGNERLITSEVEWARFSPDGAKIAFISHTRELVIQTLQGRTLAQLQNVRDPKWRSDSTLSFQVVPSADYPDLWQTFLYDLGTAKVVQSAP